jgi:hypothetical protein
MFRTASLLLMSKAMIATALAEVGLVGAQKVPPGFAFLGYGYDILLGNPMDTSGFGDPGWKTNIYKFTYNDAKMTTDGKWNVPDKCSAQPVHACSTNVTHKYFNNSDDYRKDLNVTFDIPNISYENSTRLPNPDLESIAFQFSVDSRNVFHKTQQDNVTFSMGSFTCAVYRLESDFFAHPDLDENFVVGVKEFLTVDYNEEVYLTFIQQFGTHLVSGLTSGGRWGLQTEYSKHDLEVLTDKGVNVTLGLAVQAEISAGFKIGVSTEMYAYHAVHSLEHSSATFNIGGQFNQDPKIWNLTVAENPMPFHLQLMDISMMLTPIFIKDDPQLTQKRANMVKALSNYCSHLQHTVDASIPCHKPKSMSSIVVV